MAGDKIKIMAESFYHLPSGNAGPPVSNPVMELLNLLIGSSAVLGTKGMVDANTVNVINGGTIYNFMTTNNSGTGTNTADAFLCWILSDDQFKYLDGGADAVQPNGGYKFHQTFINSPGS